MRSCCIAIRSKRTLLWCKMNSQNTHPRVITLEVLTLCVDDACHSIGLFGLLRAYCQNTFAFVMLAESLAAPIWTPKAPQFPQIYFYHLAASWLPYFLCSFTRQDMFGLPPKDFLFSCPSRSHPVLLHKISRSLMLQCLCFRFLSGSRKRTLQRPLSAVGM